MSKNRLNKLLLIAEHIVDSDTTPTQKAERFILVRRASAFFVETGSLETRENIQIRDITFPLSDSLPLNP
jgi:hypothetical protein